jgi:hypothetical protein
MLITSLRKWCIYLHDGKLSLWKVFIKIHTKIHTSWNCNSFLLVYLLFYVPLKDFSLIWRRCHSRWKATKFRPMFGVQGLYAGRDLCSNTPAVTQGLCFYMPAFQNVGVLCFNAVVHMSLSLYVHILLEKYIVFANFS